MKLTEEEKQIILEKRKQENWDRPKIQGFLRHDLTENPFYGSSNFGKHFPPEYYITKEEFLDGIEKIKKEFDDDLTISKGSRFVCYIDEDGTEEWYDGVNFGIEGMGEEWSKKHLENIRKIR
jgi:hypothetical protein